MKNDAPELVALESLRDSPGLIYFLSVGVWDEKGVGYVFAWMRLILFAEVWVYLRLLWADTHQEDIFVMFVVMVNQKR